MRQKFYKVVRVSKGGNLISAIVHGRSKFCLKYKIGKFTVAPGKSGIFVYTNLKDAIALFRYLQTLSGKSRKFKLFEVEGEKPAIMLSWLDMPTFVEKKFKEREKIVERYFDTAWVGEVKHLDTATYPNKELCFKKVKLLKDITEVAKNGTDACI